MPATQLRSEALPRSRFARENNVLRQQMSHEEFQVVKALRKIERREQQALLRKQACERRMISKRGRNKTSYKKGKKRS